MTTHGCHVIFGLVVHNGQMVTIKSRVVFKCQNLMDMNFSMTSTDAMDAPMYIYIYIFLEIYIMFSQVNLTR